MQISTALLLALTLPSMACASVSTAAPTKSPAWVPLTADAVTRPGARDDLIARTISWDVPIERARYVREFLATDLKTFLPGTKKLPGVERTEPLTEAKYPAIGSVRRVMLTDGNHAEEEVLEQDDAHLRYLVGRYTTPSAKPVAYGVGEFEFDSIGPSSTRITWTYRFKLRTDTLPGSLGGLGRMIFCAAFLSRDYADFMDSGRDAMRTWAAGLDAG